MYFILYPVPAQIIYPAHFKLPAKNSCLTKNQNYHIISTNSSSSCVRLESFRFFLPVPNYSVAGLNMKLVFVFQVRNCVPICFWEIKNTFFIFVRQVILIFWWSPYVSPLTGISLRVIRSSNCLHPTSFVSQPLMRKLQFKISVISLIQYYNRDACQWF